MRIAIYPGTFDPITNGHSDIIKRAATYICDRLIVSVAVNKDKNPLFTADERVILTKAVIDTFPPEISKKIEIVPFRGLLIDHAKAHNAKLLVRGLRAVSDFEVEFQMAAMNGRIAKDIETVFLMAAENQQFIASRFVKEIFKLGGDVSTLIHPLVLEKLSQHLNSEN